MTDSNEIDFIPALSQQFLSGIWRELQLARQMTGSFPLPEDAELFFMATAFGDAVENALYLQPMHGDTLYEDPSAHQVIYARRRSSLEAPWSPWIQQRDA